MIASAAMSRMAPRIRSASRRGTSAEGMLETFDTMAVGCRGRTNRPRGAGRSADHGARPTPGNMGAYPRLRHVVLRPMGRRPSVAGQHPCADGKTDELGAVGEPEFLHDAGTVGVDGLGADEELLADLAGAVALDGEGHHFPLALAQLGQRVLLGLLPLVLEALEQQPGGARVQEHLALRDGADRVRQLLVRA